MMIELLSPSRTRRSLFGIPLFMLATVVALLSSCATALSATGQRVLIILPSASERSLYSSFLSDLSNRGFDLSYREATQLDDQVQLIAYDERRYDHLVYFPSALENAAPASDLSPQALINFVKEGGNILFAHGSDRPDWLQDVAREFSIEIADRGQRVVDHFHHATGPKLGADKDHSKVLLGGGEGQTGFLLPKVIFSPDTLGVASSSPLLVGDASPHRLGPNPLALRIVGISATSYTAAPKGGRDIGLLGTDEDSAIASVFQTKDNSRVAFVGSADLFSDRLLSARDVKSSSGKSYPSTLNSAFLRDLTSWTFQEHGVLKVEKRSHFRVREGPTDIREAYEEPEEGGSAIMYRIKDTVTYSLDISQHTPTGWQPAPDNLDLQVSLIMIDPFITSWLVPELPSSSSSTRSTLDVAPPTSNATRRYSTSFQLPDRLGVYTFQTLWARPGWSSIKTKDVAPIRAFNHDENPRFLPASWPYALGSFSTIVSFLLFVSLWLLSNEKAGVTVGGAKEKVL